MGHNCLNFYEFFDVANQIIDYNSFLFGLSLFEDNRNFKLDL